MAEYEVRNGWLYCREDENQRMDPVASVDHILELLDAELRDRQEAGRRAADPPHPNCMIAKERA